MYQGCKLPQLAFSALHILFLKMYCIVSSIALWVHNAVEVLLDKESQCTDRCFQINQFPACQFEQIASSSEGQLEECFFLLFLQCWRLKA